MHGKPRDRKRVITSLVAVVAMVTSVVGPLPAAFAATPGGKKPRVLVIRTQKAVDVGTIVTTKIGAYMDQILAMDNTIEVVAPSTLVIPALDADVPAKPVKPAKIPKAAPKKAGPKTGVALGDDAAAAADKLMARHKPADALKEWNKALELYASDAGHLDDVSKYVKALAGRSAAYFLADYNDNGEEELSKVLAIRPDFTPASDAPEALTAALPRVQARVRPTTSQISVTADVAGAVVQIDGTTRGPAPQTIGGLNPGDHIVRVLANGRQAFGQVVVLGDVSVDVAATLPPGEGGSMADLPGVALAPTSTGPKTDDVTGLEFYVRAGNLDTGFQAQAKRIAQANNIDAIYFSYVRSDGKDYDLGMFVWKADDQRIAALVPERLASDLAGLQVDVLDVCDKATAVLRKFPDELALSGRAPIFTTAILVSDNKAQPEWHPEPTKPVEVKPVEVKPVRDPSKPVVVAPSIEARPKDSLDTMVRMTPDKDVASVSAPEIKPKHKDDDSAVYEKWWFWTIVVGVVGGSATALALTQSGGTTDPEGFRTTVSW